MYAFELTPNKKDKKTEEVKMPKEHLLTKEELIADLGKNSERGFFAALLSGVNSKKEIKSEASQVVKQEKNPEKEKGGEQQIVAPKFEKAKIAPSMTVVTEQVEENFQKANSKEAKVKKVSQKSVDEIWGVDEKLAKKAVINAVPLKVNADVSRRIAVEKKKENTVNAEKVAIKEDGHALDAAHQEILDSLMSAIRTGNPEHLRLAVESIAQLRSNDESECHNDSMLNIAIRRELFSGISSMLAHRSGKEIGRVFQLIDMLNLDMTPDDFALLPKEVLESDEMHAVTIKYLVWCAKEYEAFPVELEKRIACFVQVRIMTSTEVHELPELQSVISRSMLEYAKDNLKNPFEIERKIYQYSLAGFLNAKALKQSEKMQELARGYLVSVIEKYKDRTEDMDKKIREYELAGFVLRSELRKNEKIQKVIEKQLVHYIKANKKHPRKISMRVKEYFNMGLIEKAAMQNYLK